MTDPHEKQKVTVKPREPKKKTPGTFDNLRKLPHPIEDFLAPLEASRTPDAAPVRQTPPVIQEAPLQQTAPVPDRGEPLPETPAVHWTAPLQQTGAGYTKFPHYVADVVLNTLDVYSQAVLTQLLRLSWGFQKDDCQIGLPSLSKRAGISESQARRATRNLANWGIVQIGEQDFTNPNMHERGTRYHILLQPAPSQQRGATRETAPTSQTPNKE